MITSAVFFYSFNFFVFMILIICSVAFFTLLESKKLAAMQSSSGPNKMGKFGIFQPIVDGVKLMLKETMAPSNSFKVVFFMSSIYSFFMGLSMWVVFPFSYTFMHSNLSYGVLFVFILSIMHVYSVMLAGWSSNSHYSFLGAMSCSAQLMAYDMTMVIMLLHIYVYTKSLNMVEMVKFQSNNFWFVFPLPFVFIMFFVCALAETNSHPFDLPEAEAELVSGYNVEYSGMSFSLFFLGEYAALIFMSAFTVNFFFGAWDMFGLFSNYNMYVLKMFSSFCYFLKMWFFCYLFIYASGLVPSYSYDQLMKMGWKFMLPISFVSLLYHMMLAYYLGV